MNTKRLIINIAVMTAVLVLWQGGLKLAYHYHPEWAKSAPAVVQPTPPAPAPTAVAPPATTQSTAVLTTAPVTGAGVVAVSSPDARTAVLGSDAHVDSTYAMSVAVDPRGAGLSGVLLNDFYKEAGKTDPYTFQRPTDGHESLTRPLATRWIKLNGQSVDVSTVNWKQVSATGTAAVYQGDITDNGKPLLRITKSFTIMPRSDPSQGFEIVVDQSFTNLGAARLTIEATMNGPSVPARENEKTEDRQYVGGVDKGFQSVETIHTFVGDLAVDKPAKDVGDNSDKYPLLWAGCCNSYFDAIVLPDYVLNPKGSTIRLATATATAVGPAPVGNAEDVPTALTLVTTPFDLAPGASTPFKVHAFFGPKWRKLLKDDAYYAGFPRGYDGTLVYVSRFCGFITFSWLINLLYWVLAFFHVILRDWGLSIILLVCCVRTMLHPITKKAQVNMMGMSKMGPEIERLKKKYGDDKEGLNKAMMQVYRENGLGGFLGCLPMFLQTPIWIALWNALNSTFELRHAPFLHFGSVHLTWIADLSRPDNLYVFAAPVHLLFFSIHSINILPLLMAVVTYVQMALQPAPANMTPEQEQQRKMQKWMSLIVPVFLYNGPSGLNLYILTSSSLGLIEQKIIRDHIKQKDEAEKAGKVIVDTKPTRGGKRNQTTKPAEPTGWFARFVAKLQSTLEQARREAEKRQRDRS